MKWCRSFEAGREQGETFNMEASGTPNSFFILRNFTRQWCIGNLPHVNIFNQPVPWVTEYKYLGLILDTKLNFAKHIHSAHQKAAEMICTLNRLISPKSKLALRHKVLLYKAILHPLMLYASPIWAGAAVTHLKRLHTFQNIQLRRAANAPCGEAHFWLNGYVNKQNCRIWNEANPQVYVETPLHPEKVTAWCALWAGGILLQKR
ncbi:putative RNA-directed DNA polymerase from transposon BS [Trichonephila clavipes]|nr:putative RNA-directed DNA polymerase from transposon BS [Trichonephila clavipes]